MDDTPDLQLRSWSRREDESEHGWRLGCACGRDHWIGLSKAFAFDVEIVGISLPAPRLGVARPCVYSCRCGRAVTYTTIFGEHINAREVMTKCRECALLVAFVGICLAVFVFVMVRGS